MVVWEAFTSMESSKIYGNTVKSPEFMSSVTFTKTGQWAGLESLMGRFRLLSLRFHTPAVK